MSFFTSLQNFLTETEDDVEVIILDIKKDVAVVESKIDAALKWVAGMAPTIAADVASVTSLLSQIGVTANPEVAAAVTAANLSVQALNAFAASMNAGQSDAQAVVNGYVAVKQAQSAVASAQAAVVATPTAKAA